MYTRFSHVRRLSSKKKPRTREQKKPAIGEIRRILPGEPPAVRIFDFRERQAGEHLEKDE